MSAGELHDEITKLNQKIDIARNQYRFDVERRELLRDRLCKLLALRDVLSDMIEHKQKQ